MRLENYQALLWSIFQIGNFLREMATLSIIVKGARIYNPIHRPSRLHLLLKDECMNQKNKYLTTFTYGRGSKWYMGYGSVLLGLGGVRSQSPNQRLPYKLVDR